MNIIKDFSFAAAHRLESLPAGHKCARLHGHTFRVRLLLTGEVGEDGFVLDFNEIKAAFQPILDRLDHRYLNDIHGLTNPTCEKIARWIYDHAVVDLPLLVGVEVWESEQSGAIYLTGGRVCGE